MEDLPLTVTSLLCTGRISVPIDFEELDSFDPFAVPTIRLVITFFHRSSLWAGFVCLFVFSNVSFFL